MRAAVTSLLATGLVTACTTAPDEVATTEQAIVGGTQEFGDLDVALLVIRKGAVRALCTGTLISPHVVLTAGHCVADHVVDAVYFGAVATVGNYPQLSSQDPAYIDTANVVRAQLHPSFDPTSPTTGFDIAMVELDHIPPIEPHPINVRALDDVVGGSIRLVGWGVTDRDALDYGTKRMAWTYLGDLADDGMRHFGVPNSCGGDSGGPLFMVIDGVERVAGVTSWGDNMCTDFGFGTRVDLYAADLIAPFVQQAGDCLDCGPADDPGHDDQTTDSGGCTMTPNPSMTPWLFLMMGVALRRRRSR